MTTSLSQFLKDKKSVTLKELGNWAFNDFLTYGNNYHLAIACLGNDVVEEKLREINPKLQIKGVHKPNDHAIELVRDEGHQRDLHGHGKIDVKINNDLIAIFKDTGEFWFYGTSNKLAEYVGRWKK